ncbi:hypothetical protein BDA99DRAFT_570332 [Phascolomyces articulosus]|uniref:Pyrroloquinoline quinone-dependent pyranose dehydrogenase beta-propeller domain-containing protein n=1 Tax=Phascolomyces articulosus TaxID=60185 RepID=A0AAD5KEJ2_9FUNG|nr:hypothetical protein BDA99DRAFT_570332 [Phascolomyces articulosus]
MKKFRTKRSILLLALLGIITAPGYNAQDDIPLSADEMKLKAQGAMRVGIDDAIVPDASAEHPLVVSRPEVQPLCKPATTLQPSQEIEVMNGYEATVLTNIQGPRKMIVDPVNHILVTGNDGLSSIRLDECGNTDTRLLMEQLDDGPIRYGVALYDGQLYVASSQSVWRFPYVDGQHTPLEGGELVLININAQNDFDIAIDPFGHIYIPRSASEENVLAEKHAIIKRFNVNAVPDDAYDYETDGEIFAYGTNVHGGMGFDAQGRLWGIDAPYQPFQRSDLGGEISPGGLAEEINVYEFPYMNYGFPYCFTEYDLQSYTAQAKGKGGQWGHPSFMNGTVDLDSYCEQSENNRQPAVPIAPMNSASAVHFYMGQFCSVGSDKTMGTSVGMPCNWTDTPIVAYRGNAGQADGHRVVHLPFDDLGHKPRWDKKEDVIFQTKQACVGEGCISPVGIAVDDYGRLLVSSQDTNEIFMIQRIYNVNAARLMTDKAIALEEAEELKEAALDNEKEEKEDEEEIIQGSSLEDEEEEDEEEDMIRANTLEDEDEDDEDMIRANSLEDDEEDYLEEGGEEQLPYYYYPMNK